MSNKNNDEVSLRTVALAILIAAITIAIFLFPLPAQSVPVIEPADVPQLVETAEAKVVEQEKPTPSVTVIRALVTGYNTVPEQTDATPCIAATGDDICGRTDVVACPRAYALGTEVVIDGSKFVCLDRTAVKFDGRWDISCDKDAACPSRVHGYKEVQIIK